LLNEAAGFDAVCDGLVKWSSELWGARQSAIALLENDGTLTAESWREISCFDPDRIYSFAPISDALLAKLDEELSPWHIRRPKDNQRSDRTADGIEESIESLGVPVPPTKQNLALLQSRPLLLFDFSKDCPALLRRFLDRNLGAYYQWFDLRTGAPRRLGWLEDLLAKIPTERLPVSDLQSLCAAMERISGTPPSPNWKPPLSFTAPCELSSIHLSPHYHARGSFDHLHRVVVGSILRDFVLYWRSCLNEGYGVWNAPYRHCLWIPAELIKKESFVAALKNWLYHFTGQSSSGSRTVELTSVSLSVEELSPLIDACRTGTFRVPMRFTKPADVEKRWQDEQTRNGTTSRRIAVLNHNNAESFEANERTQTRELHPPKVIQPEVPLGVWAVDVQIEREAREGGIRGQDWWFLPRKSGRGLVASIFRAPSRVCRNGIFAVQMERTSSWTGSQTPPLLQLQLPDDRDVVRGLLLIQREPWFDYSDARRERLQIKPIITNEEISDPGRKLRGLIELFGGFWRARDYWERTFWREVFLQMARRGKRYEAKVSVTVKEMIEAERQRSGISLSGGDGQQVAEKITHRLLNHLAGRFRDTPMTFADMNELLAEIETQQQSKGAKEVQYLAGNTLVHISGVEPVKEEELKDGLEDLLRLGVFQMGMNMRCPRCRLQHWVSAENLRQSDSCSGCGSPMPLVSETPWSYRLNPLIHHCINHDVFAVWHALQELSHRLGSVFFKSSSELHFAQLINGKPKKELDVLCVTDGELLLGEVKTGALAEKYFEEFGAIAAAIRPEQAATFVESEFYDDKASRWFEKFAQQLKPLGVQGQLFCLTNY
jgi:hypothetical protein